MDSSVATKQQIDLWHLSWGDWRAVLARVFAFMSTELVTLTAAGVSYYTLLALFPALAALVLVYGMITDANSLGAHLDALAGIVPESILKFVSAELTRLIQNSSGRLGIGAVVSLLIALCSANGGVK